MRKKGVRRWRFAECRAEEIDDEVAIMSRQTLLWGKKIGLCDLRARNTRSIVARLSLSLRKKGLEAHKIFTARVRSFRPCLLSRR